MVHSIAGGAHSSHSLSWKHPVRAAGWGGNLLFTARKDTLYHTDLQLLTWRLNSKGNLLYLFPFKPTKKQYLPCYKMEQAIFYIAGVNYGRLCDLFQLLQSSHPSVPMLPTKYTSSLKASLQRQKEKTAGGAQRLSGEEQVSHLENWDSPRQQRISGL